MSKTKGTSGAAIGAKPQGEEPAKPKSPPASLPLEETDPVAANAERSKDAIWKFQEAYRIKETPPLDFIGRALQPLEVQQAVSVAEQLLEPGPTVQHGRDIVPRLGNAEPYDGARHTAVDALERPTTVAVAASEQRLRMLHKVGALQAGVDASRTANTTNSIETMLAHQVAVGHRAALHLFEFIPGLNVKDQCRSMPIAEVTRLANAACRLMDACANAALALQKLQTGGTQRVIVQHQQVALTHNGPAVVMNTRRRGWLKNGNPPGDFTTARRCGARNRRGTGCACPAMPNGRCRLHGGLSTGPRTQEGLERSRRARWKHGFYSKALLAQRTSAHDKYVELRETLRQFGFSETVTTDKTRGPRFVFRKL
jgi:hypothetical protein